MKKTKTTEMYKQALEIIRKVYTGNVKIDTLELLIFIAQERPDIIVSKYSSFFSTREKILQELKTSGKIPAITLYRHTTNSSLVDAKIAVEQIMKEENIQ